MRQLSLSETNAVAGGLLIEAGIGAIASITAGFFKVDLEYVTYGVLGFAFFEGIIKMHDPRFIVMGNVPFIMNCCYATVLFFAGCLVAGLSYEFGSYLRNLTN